MHWVRKPRLNKAVATVAVEMVLSLLRVASDSFVVMASILRFSLKAIVVPAKAGTHMWTAPVPHMWTAPVPHMWTAPVPQEFCDGLIGSLASICPACWCGG